MAEVAMADGSGLPPNFPPQAEQEQSRKSEISQLVGDDQLLSSSSPESSTPPSYSACFAAHHLQQHSASGSAVSALQSKVKALSERRAAGKDRDDKGPVLMSAGPAKPQAIKKGHEKKAPSAATGAPASGKWQTSSSDEEADTHVQEQLYQTDRPLPGDREELSAVVEGEGREACPLPAAMPRGLGEGASLENLSGGGDSFQEALSTKPWAPPEGFWKAARPETLLLNGDVQPKEEMGQSGPGAGPGVQWKAGGEFVWRELQRSDSLESHLHRCVRKEVDLAGPLGGLWRADSLESVCSSRSALSLAERVEMNRTILKEMLGAPRCKDTEGSMLDAEQRTEEMSMCNGKALTALTDGDWDSGISLQDSEHCQRAFVFSDDLPLSPRHEQAKRLLERARMKARSYPLKADHTILPPQWDNPEPLSRGGIPLRRPLTGKEGVAAASGNQSDSSGSDSVSGPRRRHGQSPTRVRFEDESEKDAEVRYLERMRQRRRAGEKAQGLLVSKPNLSSYVNGKKEGVVPTDRGRSPESILRSRRNQEDGPANKAALQEVLYKKCSSCGTFLEGVPVYHMNPNQSSDGMALPCWVAPVHPSRTVRTERIKETYIGEVAPTEDLVSKCTHCGSACSTESGTGSVAYSPYLQKVTGGDIHAVLVSQENSRPRPCGPDVNAPSGAVVLLPSPYATEQSGPNATVVKPCTCPASLLADGTPKDIPTAPKPKKSALKSGSSNRPSGQRVVKLMPSPHYHLIDLDSLDTPCSSEPDLQHGASQEPASDSEEQLCATLGYGEENPAPSSTGPAPCIRTSALKFSDHAALDLWDAAPEAPGRSHQGNGNLCHDPAGALPAARCAGDGRVRGPLRAEHRREDIPDVAHGFDSHRRVHAEGLDHREGRSKLSLRRFFSAFGLNSVGMLGKGRSSSMEHLSYSPRHSSSASPSPTHRHGGPLKKAPSLQSLRMGSPFSQMRKASSVQSLQSPKKKGDRSSAYLLGEQQYNSASSRGLQRALSVEDVGCPSRVRSVGRVAQAFPDGTLLLELSRPSHGPFGFLIARGKGRPDSGVYVEEMGDSSTQKLYAGLLGIGDEILEVNGEKVAGLSLDQVTRLMTEYSTASIRVLRHRRPLR